MNCCNSVFKTNHIMAFWSLNDELFDEKLEKQIKSMKESGINGIFLHARKGLKTQYMSDEWFNRLEKCIVEANENNIQTWIYDENAWPSGTANGEVTGSSDEYHQSYLIQYRVNESMCILPNTIAFYDITDDNVLRIQQAKVGSFAIAIAKNQYYTDIMNVKATNRFIKYTHERYYNRYKKYFDGRIAGFFTDEPQFSNGSTVPWSPEIENMYKKVYFKDILDDLALLYFDKSNYREFRYRFFKIAAMLVRENFLKPIYNWCSEHNCMLTGHMMGEDPLDYQIICTGGVMPCYEYFHVPGIDHLCKRIGSPVAPKQLSSVAAQLGRQAITETFAGCGWNVKLDELKWIADWQYTNGITAMCQHLLSYSISGERKRDWPASLFSQLPWFKDEAIKFNTFFDNLSNYLKSGEEQVDTLVIHPLMSAYMHMNYNDRSAIAKIAERFTNEITELNKEHIPYHLGDESIMEKYGHVDSNCLIVGRCSYHKIVLPCIESLTESTYQLIKTFVANGGRIFSIGEVPTMIEGKTDSRINRVSNAVVSTNLMNLRKSLNCDISILTDYIQNPSIDYICKKIDGKLSYYYFANQSCDRQDTQIVFSGRYDIEEIDLNTNLHRAVPALFDNDNTICTFRFASYQSYLIKATVHEECFVKVCPNHEFTIDECDENAYTLDYCEYRINDGEWQQRKPILMVQGLCINQGKPCDVSMRFRFNVVSMRNSMRAKVAVENPKRYSFSINGKPFDFYDEGSFCDNNIRTSFIGKFLNVGENIIEMSTHFSQSERTYKLSLTPGVHESEMNRLEYDSELEAIYIIGKFGVIFKNERQDIDHKLLASSNSFAVADFPKTVNITNITACGFPFFSGTVVISQELKIKKNEKNKYFFDIKKMCAPAAKMYVNGVLAADLVFPPFTVDISRFLNDGYNKISFKLYSGNRNLLGPHHISGDELICTSPDTFKKFDSGFWSNNYSFVPFGIEFAD